MKDSRTIKEYVDEFKVQLSKILQKGVNVKATVFPVDGEGGVLEFDLTRDEITSAIEPKDVFPSLPDAVNASSQTLVGYAERGTRFGGTLISLQPNKIALIKGEAPEGHEDGFLWNKQAADNDVNKILELVKVGSGK